MRPRAAVKLYTARNVGLLPESPPADELDGDGSSVWFVHLLKRFVSLISEWTGLLWRDSFFFFFFCNLRRRDASKSGNGAELIICAAPLFNVTATTHPQKIQQSPLLNCTGDHFLQRAPAGTVGGREGGSEREGDLKGGGGLEEGGWSGRAWPQEPQRC